MLAIKNNLMADNAARHLGKSYDALAQSVERLSSGLRINSAKDDPSGLIVSELLRAEIGGLGQAIENSERAASAIATAEGALNEVSNLLVDIRSMVTEAANTGGVTAEEIEANQTAIDSAVEAIDRISRQTEFNGQRLLDGSAGYRLSGVTASVIDNVTVFSAEFGDNSNVPVSVTYITSAQTARVTYANSTITNTVSIEVAGSKGTQAFTFVSGTNASAVMFAINQVSDATGVSASYITGGTPASGIHFDSDEFGSDQFVSVHLTSGTPAAFALQSNTTEDIGQDAVATINGHVARGLGRTVHLNSSALDLELTFDATAALGSTSFRIAGGGMKFQLGADIDAASRLNVGIASVRSESLGNATVGYLSEITAGGTKRLGSSSGPSDAAKVIDEAIAQVGSLRGRLGGLESQVIGSNTRQLEVALENVSALEATIRDADFAAETATMTREQILVQAGTSVLAANNAMAPNVLQLLR